MKHFHQPETEFVFRENSKSGDTARNLYILHWNGIVVLWAAPVMTLVGPALQVGALMLNKAKSLPTLSVYVGLPSSVCLLMLRLKCLPHWKHLWGFFPI